MKMLRHPNIGKFYLIAFLMCIITDDDCVAGEHLSMRYHGSAMVFLKCQTSLNLLGHVAAAGACPVFWHKLYRFTVVLYMAEVTGI